MLLLPVLLVSMDVSVLFLAMPQLTKHLDPSPTAALWILDSYSFVIAGLLITMGALGDRLGRRRLLLVGATVFGAGSMLAAFAQGPAMLIAARALMGFGGATLLPSSLAIISTMFAEERERSRAIGVWTAAFSGGAAVGPIVGGLLLHHYWWGSVFLINVPVVVALWLAAPLLPADSRAPDAGNAPFDLVGVGLSVGGILGAVYTVKHAALSGVNATAVAVGVLSLALLVGFVVHCIRAEHPLVDIRLLRNPTFAVAICTTLAAMMSLAATTYLINEYLQSVTGRDPLNAALLGIPMAATVCAFSLGSARIVTRLGVRGAFITALAVCATGMAVLQWTGVHDGLWAFLAGTTIAGIGYGTAFSLVSVVAVGSVPPERAGAASGISETAFELGQALGLALLGSLAAVVFARTLRPDDSPYRGTLTDAIAEAGGNTELVETAKSAFMTGMHTALGTAAVILVIMAVVTTMVLPRRTGTAPSTS
ncbi:putative transmembrane-transport protein [Gordonia crocea]|uniref:Putative transmembrane-transport protein n=2 Tax=Gordonia crocea TaxID=589162 RepID=A0A7M3SV44_9ACTN|nr:putative transmembrane-transport protein [Gordonia crocea]